MAKHPYCQIHQPNQIYFQASVWHRFSIQISPWTHFSMATSECRERWRWMMEKADRGTGEPLTPGRLLHHSLRKPLLPYLQGLLPSELHILQLSLWLCQEICTPQDNASRKCEACISLGSGGRWVRTGELRRAILADSRHIPRQTMWKLRIWKLILLPLSLPLG